MQPTTLLGWYADPQNSLAGPLFDGIITDGLPSQLPDIDPDETREWLESFDAVIDERAAAAAPGS